MEQTNSHEPPEHAGTDEDGSPSFRLQNDTKPNRWQKGDFAFAVAQQALFLLFGALLLDGGVVFRVSCIAAIGHWIAVLLVCGRRPSEPTRLDTLVVKVGFLYLFLIVYVIVVLVNRLFLY